MKRLFLLMSLIAISSGFCFSQSQALQNQFVLDKQEMASHGYTLVDEGGAETNNDWVLTFDENSYKRNYLYYIIIYLEGCSSCDPAVYFHDKRNDQVTNLDVTVQRASGVVQGVVSIKQEINARGDLSVHSASTTKVYTYTMLFKKHNR